MNIAVEILLVLVSPGLLAILGWFILELRKGGGGKEVRRLRQELDELRRDYEQTKADHNDTLLGLVSAVDRLEEAGGRRAGVETTPPAEARTPVAPRRQL
ncbi:MAG: hypothetical protein HY321_20230 [Armatimonadetes bacterium]|nr:hypothetical protein [Armatimonadota bacterium]